MNKQRLGLLSAACAAAVLVACGGGGGGDPTPPPPPPPPPPATAITIGGTAARGAALANATVSVKCATGTSAAATATTDTSGAYTLSLSGATLPCALRVVGSGGEVFHSVVAGTGNSGSFTANLTPLTELLVAHLARATPASYYAAFASASTVDSAAVGEAVDYLRIAIPEVADLDTIQPLTDALVIGDRHDLAIDTAVARLAAAGLGLAAVTDLIVANPAAPRVLGTALAPASSVCPWLRSGSYRVVDPHETSFAEATGRARIDAVGLGGTSPGGTAFQLEHRGECLFETLEPDFVTRMVVASSGLIVLQGESTSGPPERNFALAIPEQSLPLSEMAGTWNAASWEPVGTAPLALRQATIYQVSLDASGQFTALSQCVGLAACVPRAGPFSRLVVNPDGGFDEILPGGATWSRVFLFKTTAGRRVAIWVTPERQLIVAAPQQALGALPAVGSTSRYRNVQLFGNGYVAAPVAASHVVAAVDAASRSVTQRRGSDDRVDTVRWDSPREGLRHRAEDSCTLAGAGVACAELVQLPIPGMGLTISTTVGDSVVPTYFNLAVGRP